MKKPASRAFVTIGVVIALATITPAAASAGARRSVASRPIAVRTATTNTIRVRHDKATYFASRRAIELAFHRAILEARVTFRSALRIATDSAQRSVAQQNFEEAIIKAAAVRSAALTALGSPPGRHSPAHKRRFS
ncbi:MAG: hypothetical protein ACYCPT_01745 [Acidimicrobiales bacterium]